jgi:hypothetical protein
MHSPPEYQSGNALKSLLGEDDLLWSLRHTEGAFQGMRAYDPEQYAPDPVGATPTSSGPPVGAGQSIIQVHETCCNEPSFRLHGLCVHEFCALTQYVHLLMTGCEFP